MLKKEPDRYHPLQVTFHWLVVLLLLALFVVGKNMAGLPNDTGKAPDWALKKNETLTLIHDLLLKRNTWQGKRMDAPELPV